MCEAILDVLQPRSLIRPDGSVLRVYSNRPKDRRPTVLLINAPGMPADFFARIAGKLHADYRVLTWETRGVPNYEDPFDDTRVSLDDQIQDACHVLADEAVQDCHVVGWCGGAQLGLMLSSGDVPIVRSLVLLNGMYNIEEHDAPRTDFESQLRKLLPGIARNRRYADLFHKMLFASSGRPSDESREIKSDVYRIMMDRDPEILLLSSRPLETPEAVYRFARVTLPYFEAQVLGVAKGVKAPALVLTGAGDREANATESQIIAQRMPNAELRMDDCSGHYALYTEDTVAERIKAFFDTIETNASRSIPT